MLTRQAIPALSLAALLLVGVPRAEAQTVDNWCVSGFASTGAPIWSPASATTPCPVQDVTGWNYGNHASFLSGSTVASTTVATTLIPAPASGKIYVTGIQCGRNDAGTTATTITFNDGASTVLVIPGSTGGAVSDPIFQVPLVVGTTTALTFKSSLSLTSAYCSAQGYNAP